MIIRNCLFFRVFRMPALRLIACAPLIAFACASCALACALFAVLGGCGFNAALAPSPSGAISIMTYNTQCFFDAEQNGEEFAEFIGSSTPWSQARYDIRLERLKEAILVSGIAAGMGPERGPDVVVLQEIENSSVVRDLCGRMPVASRYGYAAFVPPLSGNAFGSAVISRFPVLSVRTHDADSPDYALRPILEVVLDAGTPVAVFAVHWKSKTGDDEGRALRLAQETVLAEVCARYKQNNPDSCVIACGDFNQQPEEFTVLAELHNCWERIPEASGSYLYQGNWEKIDHFFWSSDATPYRFAKCMVVSQEPLVSAEGQPARYEIFSGTGFSDHLPLVLVMERNN